MQTSSQIYNEIRKCKYNKGTIMQDTYPNYLSEYMQYINEDNRCADLDYIHNIYGNPNQNPIIEGFSASTGFVIGGVLLSIICMIIMALIYRYLKNNAIF